MGIRAVTVGEPAILRAGLEARAQGVIQFFVRIGLEPLEKIAEVNCFSPAKFSERVNVGKHPSSAEAVLMTTYRTDGRMAVPFKAPHKCKE
jgi:hypothetical protein